MALIMSGVSVCVVCGKTVQERESVTATPAFLRNSHPLARFSDAVFHRACFEGFPEREQVEQLLARFKEILSNGPRGSTLEEYEAWLRRTMADSEL